MKVLTSIVIMQVRRVAFCFMHSSTWRTHVACSAIIMAMVAMWLHSYGGAYNYSTTWLLTGLSDIAVVFSECGIVRKQVPNNDRSTCWARFLVNGLVCC